MALAKKATKNTFRVLVKKDKSIGPKVYKEKYVKPCQQKMEQMGIVCKGYNK